MHAVRTWSQLTHTFPTLHSASQHEQSLAALRQTFVNGIYRKYNPWAASHPAMCTACLAVKPVGLAAPKPNKTPTNKVKHQIEPRPFPASDKAVKTRHIWVSQLAVRWRRRLGCKSGVIALRYQQRALVACQGAEVMSPDHWSLL